MSNTVNLCKKINCQNIASSGAPVKPVRFAKPVKIVKNISSCDGAPVKTVETPFIIPINLILFIVSPRE